MQWYVYLMTASSAVVCGWSSLVLFGRPARLLFELRREVLAQLLAFGNIAPPKPRETAVTSREIRKYDEAVRKLREAERIFRDLGSKLLAFSESEPTLCAMLHLFGLNIVAAGDGLNDLAETYLNPGPERTGLCHEVENALRATTTRYRRHRLLDYQYRFLQVGEIGLTALRQGKVRKRTAHETNEPLNRLRVRLIERIRISPGGTPSPKGRLLWGCVAGRGRLAAS